jgi:hypothetical protein
MSLRACFVLVLSCTAASADTSTPSHARPHQATPMHALRGPFASLDEYCAQRHLDDDWVRECTVARRRPHTAALVTRTGAGQRSVLLAVESGGWWIDEGEERDWGLLHDDSRGRVTFEILGLGDGAGGPRLRGLEWTWQKPPDEHTDERYDCSTVEVRCASSRSGQPRCTKPLVVAEQRDCQPPQLFDFSGDPSF